MVPRKLLNVSLTLGLATAVDRLVASDRHQSAGEVVRASLRLLERDDGRDRRNRPESCEHGREAR
jgi:putative addiction module CopG family antidote